MTRTLVIAGGHCSAGAADSAGAAAPGRLTWTSALRPACQPRDRAAHRLQETLGHGEPQPHAVTRRCGRRAARTARHAQLELVRDTRPWRTPPAARWAGSQARSSGGRPAGEWASALEKGWPAPFQRATGIRAYQGQSSGTRSARCCRGQPERQGRPARPRRRTWAAGTAAATRWPGGSCPAGCRSGRPAESAPSSMVASSAASSAGSTARRSAAAC